MNRNDNDRRSHPVAARKAALLAGIALFASIALGACGIRGAIATRLMERALRTNLASNRLAELPDGLHVALCGAGSPLPDPERSGPCVAVVAGKRLYVVDTGAGTARNLARMFLPPSEVRAVLLTHFHSDHIDGLGELLMQRWAGGGSPEPLPVHGPDGVDEVVEGFNLAYRQDASYRVAHHGEAIVPRTGAGGAARPFGVPKDGDGTVILESGGLRVTAFRVDHAPVSPAVGYRFDYGGRSVVVSGDTKKSANLVAFARGADLLVHEALSPELVRIITRAAEDAGRPRIAKLTSDILDYHTSPIEAAEVAREAGVRHLLYYHVVPPLPLSALESVFLEGVAGRYQGPVTVGRDGTFVSLPANSAAIETDELL